MKSDNLHIIWYVVFQHSRNPLPSNTYSYYGGSRKRSSGKMKKFARKILYLEKKCEKTVEVEMKWLFNEYVI